MKTVQSKKVDALEAIYDRRAVRESTGVHPSRETIHELLEAAVQAPSAMDLQPWEFVIVQDAALLKRISDRSKKLSLHHMKPGSGLSLFRRELEDPKTDIFHGAGTAIIIVAKPGEWPAIEDCCLAAQNLMLAAHAMGLATCPIGFAREALQEPSFQKELGIGEHHLPAMAIAVGYAKSRPKGPPRKPPHVLAWR
jgi:nitroreductase